jgi:hypothetical protein
MDEATEGRDGVVEACPVHGMFDLKGDCAQCQNYSVDAALRKAGFDLLLPGEEEEQPANIRVKGKVAELRAELTNNGKKDKNHAAKKNALKKIVANMTMSNNDMVALFPDVINCMQIQNLEIKKM